MFSTIDIFVALVVLLVGIYYYFTSGFDFWEIRGVKGPKPIPIFGNFKELMLRRESIGTVVSKIYNSFKDQPFIGIFIGSKPNLIIKNPDYIKDVLIKDFSVFSDRGVYVNEKADPLSQHLFSLQPKKWRPLRVRLSPVFTSGKLKEMFKLILECSDEFQKYLEDEMSKSDIVEFREITARFTTDVIGSCAFGINMNAMSHEDSEFRRMGKKIFDIDFFRFLKVRMREMVPTIYNVLARFLPPTEITTFFTNSIRETITYRKQHNVKRHDFVDTLMDIETNPEKLGDEIEVNDSFLAAQAFIFFLAGFETSSTTMSHALYELAQHQDVQEKARAEIIEELDNTNNILTYENIKKMNYLDMVFKETLRKYPPVMTLSRKSLTEYTFEGTKLTIPKSTRMMIPVLAIHRDPEIYPNPDDFIPERFDDISMKSRHPMFYLPFGDGPRNCIGARFGTFQTKVGLVKILQRYKVDVCEKTQIPYIANEKNFLLGPATGIYLKLTKLA